MTNVHDIYVRPYESTDRHAVLSLVRELHLYERLLHGRKKPPSELGGWYLDFLIADCNAHDGAIFVAEADGETVGFVCVLGHVEDEERDEIPHAYAIIEDLAVTASWRGRGVGRALLNRAETHCRAIGTKWLRIGVLARNRNARNLYASRGFKEHMIILEKPMADPSHSHAATASEGPARGRQSGSRKAS